MTDQAAPRDLIGYANTRPRVRWPGGAQIAINFVLDHEEGAEACVLNGDAASETALSDLYMPSPMRGERNLNMESAYEYDSRVGIWRLLRIIEERQVPFTVCAVGLALDRQPRAAEALARLDCDFVSHGWRWIDYHGMEEATERDHIERASAAIARHTGRRPQGYYCGRPSYNTRRLVASAGFVYDCDAYNDELPYWVTVAGQPHLVIPHTLDNNCPPSAPIGQFE